MSTIDTTTAMKMALDFAIMHHTDAGYTEVRYAVQSALRVALASQGEALAQSRSDVEQPAQDNTYGYAKGLAESLFKKHYAHEEHYASDRIVWDVSDTTIGLLTQIDNMVCPLVRPAEQPAQQSAERVEPVGCEGAVVNGRVYADRLEHEYKFECEAGPLHLCADWVEFRRCFEWLAQHTSPPAQRTWVNATTWRRLTDVERRAVRNGVPYCQFMSAGEYAEHVQKATEFMLLEKNSD